MKSYEFCSQISRSFLSFFSVSLFFTEINYCKRLPNKSHALNRKLGKIPSVRFLSYCCDDFLKLACNKPYEPYWDAPFGKKKRKG